MTANHSQTPCSEIDFIDLSRFAMPLRRMSGNRYRRAIQKRRRIFSGVTNDSGFGRCTAVARIAPSAAGMWFAGYEYRLFDSGGGCFPSAADREAYPTRDDAIRAMTDDLRFVFLRAASITGNPENIRTHAQKMFEMLKARLDPPAQLDLFAPIPPEQENGRQS
jgi:hypothetical protein